MSSDEAIIKEVYQWCEDALLDLSTTVDSRRVLLQAIQKARASERAKIIKIIKNKYTSNVFGAGDFKEQLLRIIEELGGSS